jgi:hypothetical protein
MQNTQIELLRALVELRLDQYAAAEEALYNAGWGRQVSYALIESGRAKAAYDEAFNEYIAAVRAPKEKTT